MTASYSFSGLSQLQQNLDNCHVTVKMVKARSTISYRLRAKKIRKVAKGIPEKPLASLTPIAIPTRAPWTAEELSLLQQVFESHSGCPPLLERMKLKSMMPGGCYMAHINVRIISLSNTDLANNTQEWFANERKKKGLPEPDELAYVRTTLLDDNVPY